MDERLITQALQEIARKEIPDDMNRFPEIQKQLERFSRSAARSRVSWVAAAILTMLALSVVAYAAARLLQITPLDPGLQGANEADLLTMLDMEQTVDGVTVTLEYAYADANRLSFALTSAGTAPADIQYRFGDLLLTSSEGYPIMPMFGGGGGGGGSTDNPALNTYDLSTVGSYDTTAIQGDPDTLNLRVETTIQVFSAVDETMGDGSSPGGGGGSAGSGEPPAPERTIGPFIFEFTIPFIGGQVVEPQQEASANDITMRLERLVIAPSMTRGVVCLNPAGEPGYIPTLSLTVDGEPVSLTDAIVTLIVTEQDTPGCYDLQITQSLYQRPGEWRLSFDSLGVNLPVGVSSGSNDTMMDFRIDGAPDALAIVRASLEPALEPYGITLTEDPGSLKFSYDPNADIDEQAIHALVNAGMREETPGPWVFSFDVPSVQ